MNIKNWVPCQSCGRQAQRVALVTVRALLQDEFASQLASDDHSCCESSGAGSRPITSDGGWRFCGSQDCDVVYFSERDDTAFRMSQLRVAVGVKEAAGERPLCYCFNHSVATIKEALQTEGHSDALEDIRARMKNPGCRCETENPSGTCCLGSVSNGIRIARQELGMAVSDDKPSDAPPTASNRGENIAKAGTLVSAVMASSCCWLPLMLLAVGVSGAGIASTLEAYRPLFTVVTTGFLGAAFFFTYRPQKATADSDRRATEPGDAANCCAPAIRGRFRIMTFNKAMLWFVTVLAIGFLFFPSYVGALMGGGDGETVTDNMNRATITVEGMTCKGCSALVAKAIRRIPGVLAVEVNYERGQAVVGTEICCPVPAKEIVMALDEAGYKGSLVGSKKTTSTEENQTSACCAVAVQQDNAIASVSDENDAAAAKQEVPMLQVLSEDAKSLKAAFNEHVGDARVILLLSPG